MIPASLLVEVELWRIEHAEQVRSAIRDAQARQPTHHDWMASLERQWLRWIDWTADGMLAEAVTR